MNKQTMWCPVAGKWAKDGKVYSGPAGQDYLGPCVEWPACKKCASGNAGERDNGEVKDLLENGGEG